MINDLKDKNKFTISSFDNKCLCLDVAHIEPLVVTQVQDLNSMI